MTVPDSVLTSTVSIGSDVFQLAVKAYHNQEWALFSGLLLTGVVFLLRFLKAASYVPPRLVPWVTVALSILVSIATGLRTGTDVGTVLSTGVLVGVGAVGGWETVGKLIRDLVRR